MCNVDPRTVGSIFVEGPLPSCPVDISYMISVDRGTRVREAPAQANEMTLKSSARK